VVFNYLVVETKKRIPVALGKTSTGTLFETDLVSAGHLFISYSEPEVLYTYYEAWLSTLLYNRDNLVYSFAIKGFFKGYQQVAAAQLRYLYGTKETGGPLNMSFNGFIAQLQRELKKRQKNLAALKKTEHPVHLIFIDEIMLLLFPCKKNTAQKFTELLLNGAEAGMHFIMATYSTYRNLLQQLRLLQPKTVSQPKGINVVTGNLLPAASGDELIMTPEGLLFYKKKSQEDFQRLFPL
jgi:hypothetical protein